MGVWDLTVGDLLQWRGASVWEETLRGAWLLLIRFYIYTWVMQLLFYCNWKPCIVICFLNWNVFNLTWTERAILRCVRYSGHSQHQWTGWSDLPVHELWPPEETVFQSHSERAGPYQRAARAGYLSHNIKLWLTQILVFNAILANGYFKDFLLSSSASNNCYKVLFTF